MITAEETTSGTHLSVVRGAQANDAGAWASLVRAYSRRIYRWCRLAGLQPADATNVVQDVLRAVVRKIGDFRRDRAGDSFRGWIRTITDNKIRDHLRRERRQLARASGGTDAFRQLAEFPDEAAAPDDDEIDDGSAGAELAAELCARVRNEVSERDWRLFWRVVVDGQSAGEAGAECGVSANAARLVKMRVLRRLRQLAATECVAAPSS